MARTYSNTRLSVLIVDDELLTWRMVGTLLEADEHYVMAATSGPRALDLFTQGEWDAVIIDRMMPGMSGEELAIELKILRPQTPVLMLSGQPPEHCPPGVDALLTKPFRRAALAEAISRCLAATS